MDGLGWAHIRATSLMSAFSAMSRLDTDHFPDTLGHIFVVRAGTRSHSCDRIHISDEPDRTGCVRMVRIAARQVNGSRIFTALWAIASTFLAESTCAKVSVYSWSEAEPMRAALREACGADALPQELGGTRADAPPYHHA